MLFALWIIQRQSSTCCHCVCICIERLLSDHPDHKTALADIDRQSSTCCHCVFCIEILLSDHPDHKTALAELYKAAPLAVFAFERLLSDRPGYKTALAELYKAALAVFALRDFYFNPSVHKDKPTLIDWIGGNEAAAAMEHQTDDEVLSDVMRIFRTLFSTISRPDFFKIIRWS